MTSSVRFFETLAAMQADGVTSLVEVGPARVLCGLARTSVPDLHAASVGSDADAEAFRIAATGEAAPEVERIAVDD
jgi:malonyl CoA-acyl carrier protein transacylase